MSEEQFFKERPETNILVQVLQKYLPFWPLFFVSMGLGWVISWYNLRQQTLIYMSSAKVLLKDPQKSGGESKVLESMNVFSEKKVVENELIVLRSSSLMQEVVDSLDLYATVFNEGKVRIEELYKSNSPVLFKAVNKDSIVGGGKHYFTVDWKNNAIKILEQVVPFDSTIRVGKTIYRIIPNPDYAHNLIGKNYYVVFNSLAGAAGGIIGSLSANTPSYTSSVIDVKLEITVPEKGADILNKLFEVYNRNAILEKNQMSAQTLRFIQDRLQFVMNQLDSVEKNIQAYKSKTGVLDLDVQSKLYIDNVTDLDKRSSEIDLQLEILKSIETYINSKGKKPGTVPALGIISDPILGSLLQRLYDSEFQLDKLESSTGEKSEAVIMARDAIVRIKNDIRENIVNIRTNLLTVKNNINSRISLNNGMLSQIPQKEQGLLEISRQQAIKNNIYTYLLQRREEAALSSASTTADLRVLESATAWGPIRPVPRNFYLTGLIIGFLIAVGYVLFREQFNRKILFRADIEEKISVPVLAEIIQTTTKETIAISEGKRTIIAEQFRSLRTNLAFMGLNEKQNTLLVTSSISGEGKSFIALNLAMSITLTGKKVALMEMDLRKPKLSRYIGVRRDPGISSYLIGKASIDEIIKETSYPNLFVISSGPIPPNPTELIGAANFAELIAGLKERFDYIIIDSPPIGPVIDSQLISAFAAVTIYVVRHAHTSKVFLRLIDDLYKQKKFNNMAIVFNGLKRRGLFASILHSYGYEYGSYGYGYGYGHGYGYGTGGYGYYVSDERKGGFKIFRRLKKFLGRS